MKLSELSLTDRLHLCREPRADPQYGFQTSQEPDSKKIKVESDDDDELIEEPVTIIEIEDNDSANVSSPTFTSTNDNLEVEPQVDSTTSDDLLDRVAIKKERKDTGYDDDEDCFEDVGTLIDIFGE